MRSQAVVLTYPGHFLLTKLTLRSIKKHISNIKNITVLADDLSVMAWDNYRAHCKELYQTDIIFTSDLQLERLLELRRHPWVKQQVIKMYLDKIFPHCCEIFFSDGDVVFYHDVDYQCVPYFRMTQTHIFEQQKNYIQQALGVDNYHGIVLNNRVIATSGPPFRDMVLAVLPVLRNAVESNTNQNFTDYHLKVMQDTLQSISEWEILEYYKLHFLDQNLDFQYYHLQFLDQPLTRNPGKYFGSCFCCDKNFGEQWWNNSNIDYKKYWGQLPIMKYY